MAKNIIEIIILGKDAASQALGGVGKMLGGVGDNLGKLGGIAIGAATAAVGALGAMGAGIAKLAIDAAPLQGIESAFEAITERSGESMDTMLAALEKGSAGMISQRDLMISYNRASSLVSDTFANELPNAMGLLTKAAAATGEDMGYMMDSLVRGVGRVSPMILDNLGVQMDMNKALEDYATKHGIGATVTAIDNSEAMARLAQDLSSAEQELAGMEQAYHAANAEFIHAQQIWPQGSVELVKFQTRVEKAQSALDKKTAGLAEMRGELSELQSEHGKTVTSTEGLTEALTKDQQQMAIYEQVVAKLQERYGDMPDVTESVSTSIAAMGAKFRNFKDTVGKAVLPIAGKVMSKFSEMADKIFPMVAGFVETTLVPALQVLANVFGAVFDKIMTGEMNLEIFRDILKTIAPTLKTLADVFGAMFDKIMAGEMNLETFRDILETLLPREIVDRVMSFVEGILNLVETVKPYVEMAMKWIAENIQLKDVLLALGIAIVSFIIPIIASLIATALPLIATFVGLVAAIALLRTAWETDWGGIRTALTEFWENTAKPALTQLWEWLKVSIPIAIQALSDFWQNTLLPALNTVWGFIQESILPILATLWAWLKENLPLAIQALADFWNNVLQPALSTIWSFIQESVLPLLAILWAWLKENLPLAIQELADFWNNVLWPALQAIWAFIRDYIIPLFLAMADVMDAVVGLAITALAGLWQKVLWPALQKVWAFIQDNIIPIFVKLTDTAGEELGPVLQWLKDKVVEPLRVIFEKVKDVIEKVIETAGSFADTIRNITLPDWLTPGSATPFELGLSGIAATVVEQLIPAFSGFMAMLTERWMALGAYLLEESWPALREAWTLLTLTMQELWSQAMIAIAAAFAVLVAAVLAGIASMILAWQSLKSAIDEVAAAIARVTSNLEKMVSEKILDGLREFASLIESIARKFERMAEAAEDAYNWAKKAAGAGGGGGPPGAQAGIWRVPRIMPALLHPGEMVLPSARAEAYRRGEETTHSTVRNVTNYFNMTVNTRAETSTVIQDFNILRALA